MKRLWQLLVLVTAGLALSAGVGAVRPAKPRVAPQARDTSWVAHSALYEVNIRDFSSAGDLRGVTEGLDRIQAVGATVVWLMPVHPVGVKNRKGPLGSPYAPQDYRAIDPAFGTAQDFRDLVRAVHARGMKLIIDWVPDHTGWDHVWVTEHPDYYVRTNGQLTIPRDPAGKSTDWDDVVQLDYANPALRQAMIAAMRYWLEEFGIDGFRVDAAGFVPDTFWREAIPALRSAVRRPILLLAEWGDLHMHRLGFDLTYGWDAYSRLKAVWRGTPADSFVTPELATMQAMPPGGMRMRFSTNHDETAWDNPPVTLFGGSAGARAAFTAIALLPGRPLLYDGQEVESPQKLGLFTREAIEWNQPGADSARAFYGRVLKLDGTDPAFLGSDFAPVQTSAPGDVIAYRRREVVVVINARSHEVRLVIPGFPLDGAQDLLSDRQVHGDTLTLAPYGVSVMAKR